MPSVVHLTTVHEPFDSRIFHRECKALAKAGYDVALLAPGRTDSIVDGIQVGSLPRSNHRVLRMSLGVGRTLIKALGRRADLYHFHDPELIPAGLLLRLLGKRVIYDIHEDNRTALEEREYLPSPLRTLTARLFAWAEESSSRHFHLVLAERYYAERFPCGETVFKLRPVPGTGRRPAGRPPSGGKPEADLHWQRHNLPGRAPSRRAP